MKVYGPYTGKDGRKRVVHHDPSTNTRTCQSYPRHLMEQHLGRKLEPWEQVDHINDDPTDDRIENYQILTAKDNTNKSVDSRGKRAKVLTVSCIHCGKSFQKPARKEKYRLSVGQTGPFCSHTCSGKYHSPGPLRT